jgi:hypothetical protein
MTRKPKTRWIVLKDPPPPKCGAQPGPRSTARCEYPPNHDGPHLGRTRGGYWRGWPEDKR